MGSRPGRVDLSRDDELDAVLEAAYPRLMAYARLLTGDRVQAEDVVHEAFVRYLRRSRRGEIREFIPYVRRAIVNEVVRAAGRRRREPRPEPQRAAYPQDTVIEHETLRDWLTRLPARQRVAIVTRYYLDMSEQDTAAVMGCSVSAVKSLCSRGITVLRNAEDIQMTKGVLAPQSRQTITGLEA